MTSVALTDVAGRFGLSDVTPVVGSTGPREFPARAVVGEQVPITATVFREGHDAVGANVVLRDPDGPARAAPVAHGAGRARAPTAGTPTSSPTAPGLWTFAVEAWSDPLATWHHAVDVKIEAGPGRRGPRQRPRGRRPAASTGSPRRCPSRRPRARARRGRGAARHLAWTSPTASPRRSTTSCSSSSHEHPVRELVTGSPRYPLWVDRRARALRLLVRVLPPLDRRRARRRPVAPGPARSARHVRGRHRAPRLRRVDWASTSSTCRRSTRSAR